MNKDCKEALSYIKDALSEIAPDEVLDGLEFSNNLNIEVNPNTGERRPSLGLMDLRITTVGQDLAIHDYIVCIEDGKAKLVDEFSPTSALDINQEETCPSSGRSQ